VNLGTRINLCRERHQGSRRWPAEHEETCWRWKRWSAAVARPADRAAGRPAPAAVPRAAPPVPQRIGQLDLSCAQCHDERAGGRWARR
jgi:sulfur-oxidizing protein SoxA